MLYYCAKEEVIIKCKQYLFSQLLGGCKDRQAAYVCTNGAACCTEFARPQHNQPNPADRGYRELGCMKGGDWYLHKGGHEEGVVGTDAQVAAPRGGICWVKVI